MEVAQALKVLGIESNNYEIAKSMECDLFELLWHKEIESIDELLESLTIDELDYDGSIHMITDGNIDIYTSDLMKWFAENYEYVERAIEEGLTDTSKADIPAMAQAGQYMQLNEELYALIEEIYKATSLILSSDDEEDLKLIENFKKELEIES